MIKFPQGNIFQAKTHALVNPVNLVGISGKGLALEFKKRFPINFMFYRDMCKNHPVKIGDVFPFNYEKGHKELKAHKIEQELWIVNFPTKRHYSEKSTVSIIEQGLKILVNFIRDYKIKSIAIPALGCGEGGLEWEQVKTLMMEYLSDMDCEVLAYEPH